jgi:hypothetical protein
VTVRASEDTRSRAVAALQRGYATGALHTGTFSHRVDRALTARTHNELRGLTADLEAAPAWSRWLPRRLAVRRATPALALPDPAGLAGAAIELGRSSRCQLVFADDSVSRHHAILHVRDGIWFVRDQDSLNGTWVNGRRVVEAELRPGDELRLGELSLRL